MSLRIYPVSWSWLSYQPFKLIGVLRRVRSIKIVQSLIRPVLQLLIGLIGILMQSRLDYGNATLDAYLLDTGHCNPVSRLFCFLLGSTTR